MCLNISNIIQNYFYMDSFQYTRNLQIDFNA